MAPDQLLEANQAEKLEVKGYFETTGFERWNRIYSDSDDVNRVQRNIRIGHQKNSGQRAGLAAGAGRIGGPQLL